jgi:hypothetical protein
MIESRRPDTHQLAPGGSAHPSRARPECPPLDRRSRSLLPSNSCAGRPLLTTQLSVHNNAPYSRLSHRAPEMYSPSDDLDPNLSPDPPHHASIMSRTIIRVKFPNMVSTSHQGTKVIVVFILKRNRADHSRFSHRRTMH